MSIQSIIVMCSVPFIAILAASRAQAAGIIATRGAQQLVPGLLIVGPIGLYALMIGETPPAIPASLRAGPGLQVLLVAALLAVLGVTQLLGRRALLWVDSCTPAVLLGMAAVSLGMAFGRELAPPLVVAALWQLATLWAVLRAERLLRAWLRPGDLPLLVGLLGTPGVLLVAVLHSRISCGGAALGPCQGGLAQTPLLVVAVAALCAVALAYRHVRRPVGEAALPERLRPPV